MLLIYFLFEQVCLPCIKQFMLIKIQKVFVQRRNLFRWKLLLERKERFFSLFSCFWKKLYSSQHETFAESRKTLTLFTEHMNTLPLSRRVRIRWRWEQQKKSEITNLFGKSCTILHNKAGFMEIAFWSLENLFMRINFYFLWKKKTRNLLAKRIHPVWSLQHIWKHYIILSSTACTV